MTRTARRRSSLRPGALALLVVAALAAACGSPPERSDSGADIVRIGLSPYFEYQPWVIADELGLDEQQGIDLQFTSIESTQTAAVAARRGDIDLVPSCHSCAFPFYKEIPELRDFMITNQFKGFIVVGRTGQTDTFEELSASIGPDAAKERILHGLRGKTFVIQRAGYEALLVAALDQVGMTIDDIEIVDMPDDSAAALAFTSGTGDYYIGSLPQEARLLQEPDRFVNVGGTDILGPAGLWYSTMLATEDWLNDNHDTVLRLMAVWYRTMRYLDEQPQRTLPMFTEAINTAAASDLPLSEVEYIVAELEFFPTLQQAAETVYNPESELYFRQSVDFYAKGNADKLPEDFVVDDVVVDDRYFDELRRNQELVSWIDSPLS